MQVDLSGEAVGSWSLFVASVRVAVGQSVVVGVEIGRRGDSDN
jgi:hypothetical protein